MRINKIPTVLLIISLVYVLGLFIAPMTMEPGTVGPISGQANQFTFLDEWSELPLYHRFIYSFSDFNCHQMHNRSYFINGNQMPVCARCAGIFVGISIGLLAMVFVKPYFDYKDTLLQFVPGNHFNRKKNIKILILFLLAAVVALPMVLDGGIQMVTDYESTNPIRTLTGLIFGIGLSVFVMALFMSSIAEARENNKYRGLPASKTEDLQWQNGKVNQKRKPQAEEEDSHVKRRSSK